MQESTVENAREFADQLYKFSKLALESYSVKQQAKDIPLEYIRLNLPPEQEGICTVLAAFHLLDVNTGGVGEEFYTIDIDVLSSELDKFIMHYKIAQVDKSQTRKSRCIDYSINRFIGTYNAIALK